MCCKQIEDKVKKNIETSFIEVNSNDNIHFYLIVVAKIFEGISKIKQHKMIMELFTEEIANQEIHALSVKTFTEKKWEEQKSK